MTPLLIDEPETGREDATTIILAHGAGTPMDHEGMQLLTDGFVARGFRIIRFEFPFMHARREGRRPGPDRMPKLQGCFLDVIASVEAPVVLAGRSMGGRVATMIADQVGAEAVVAFGYPFHPPRKPENLRTAHLENLRTRTLIVQGERDPFGTQPEIASYALSEQIEMLWLEDGDHSLMPRKKSGFTFQQHIAKSLDRAADFIRSN